MTVYVFSAFVIVIFLVESATTDSRGYRASEGNEI